MFTFTKVELRQILSDAITDFAGKGAMDYIEQYRQDRAATVERIMAQLEAGQPQRDTRLENSLPAIDEPLLCQCGHEERWHDNEDSHCDKCDCGLFQETLFPNYSKETSIGLALSMMTDDIPFDGQPTPYESDDDSPAELGLQPVA